MIKRVTTLTLMVISLSPATAALQCGPFKLLQQKGTFYVNGVKPKKQTRAYTGQKGDEQNVTYHLLVRNIRAPGMLAMDHIYRHGVATLKAEIVRTSGSQIKLTGFYDCEKVE